MTIIGPIVPRRYYLPVACPYPILANGVSTSYGELLVCARTGRMWIHGTDGTSAKIIPVVPEFREDSVLFGETLSGIAGYAAGTAPVTNVAGVQVYGAELRVLSQKNGAALASLYAGNANFTGLSVNGSGTILLTSTQALNATGNINVTGAKIGFRNQGMATTSAYYCYAVADFGVEIGHTTPTNAPYDLIVNFKNTECDVKKVITANGGIKLPSITSASQLATDASGNIVAGSPFTPIRQVYTSSTSNIAIPSGATYLDIIAFGGGGGGGGGSAGAAGTLRCGGGGSGASSTGRFTWPVSQLSGTLTVTIGAGGTGGAGAITNGGSGSTGGTGGVTSITGTYLGTSGFRLAYAVGPSGGQGGGFNASSSFGSGGSSVGWTGGNGGAGASGPGSVGGGNAGVHSYASCGGGGGGGVTTANLVGVGGSSPGTALPGDAATSGGLASGFAGASESAGRGTSWDYGRSGGGGGAGNSSGVGGAGGAGGFGAGGGGGGAGVGTGGTGGAGGNGLVILYWR